MRSKELHHPFTLTNKHPQPPAMSMAPVYRLSCIWGIYEGSEDAINCQYHFEVHVLEVHDTVAVFGIRDHIPGSYC